jgi:chemotaxis protein CheX
MVANEHRESWASLLGLSAQEVFTLMLGCDLAVATEPFSEEEFDVTSMVGLAGSLCGILALRCHSKSASRIASKLLGVDEATAGPEIWDALGEVCNMVAGNFKNKITGLGDGCKLSVPTVITGANYTLYPLADDYRIAVNLSFDGLPVTVSLNLNG